MLGVSDTSGSVLGSRSGDIAASAAGTISGGGSGGRNGSNEAAVVAADAGSMFDSNGNNSNNNSGEDDNRVGGGRVDEGYGRSFGGSGNRWPRQETLALLKIRSDMDSAFREASVKGPLWDEVSRKLAELGYHRNAKKCKEKFENVYKYHKRTKDGRTSKSDGKTYRFFDQLEAFQSQPSIQPSPPPPPPQPQQVKPAMTTSTNPPNIVLPNINLTVPSFPLTNPTSQSISPPPPISPTIPSFPNISLDLMSNSTSSSTSSDLGLEGNRKRKRKWKDFFERLMKEVIQKQEEMQKKFLEAIEKREHERMVREEAWRMQELSRFNREREVLAHERSVAAAKDAAVMSFLQKLSEQQNPRQAQNTNPLPPSPSPPQPQPPPPPPQQQKQQQLQVPPKPVSTVASAEQPVAGAISAPATVPPVAAAPMPMMNSDADNGDQTYAPSPSRWPKVEIEALIKIRTSLDSKYQDNGPKGPLWEEISSAMKKLGYNRNAKRCKEKWENINKYYKKVKESNKKRPEDSKTCPYFHQLDALYREKNKHDGSSKPENNSVPLMVRPEQQWPPRPEPDRQDERDHVMEDMESDHNEDEEEEEDDGGSYEIVASKPVSMGT